MAACPGSRPSARSASPSPSAASTGSFDGYYTTEVLGFPVSLKLAQEGARVTGALGLEGVSYRVDGQLKDGILTGRMYDSSTGLGSEISAQVQGDRVLLTEYRRKVFGGGVKEVLWNFQRAQEPAARTARAGGSRAAEGHAEGGKDGNLVGTWGYSDSYVSGSYSFATQTTMAFHPDGSYASSYGAGGGGDFVSAVSSGPSGGGQWMTQDAHIYLREGPGSEWERYGRYYIEGRKMLVTRESGDKEFWQRR